MKEISLVINYNDNETLAENLIKNLKEVFEDKVRIEVVYINLLTCDSKIDSDAVLVMGKNSVSKIKNLVSDFKKIILVSRTFSENSLYKIYDIPKNTSVLVVNDTVESSNEIVALLYQLDIKHINLIAYDKETTDLSKYSLVITPGESIRVPKSIKNIIDIGHRKFDMQTFLEILNVIELYDNDVNERLIKYTQTIVEKNTGVKKRYIESYILNETLKSILQLSREGMLVVNAEYDVVYYNTKVEEILGTKISVGQNLRKYIYNVNYQMMVSEDFSMELIKENSQHIMVSKVALHVFDETKGYYFNFNTANSISKSRNELSKRLYKNGVFARYSFENIIYKSEVMNSCIELAKKYALTNYTVLITGESGTGKELIAQSIHNYSSRKEEPFVAVNCAALPESLLESELFGYEAGAFTGSKKEGKLGLFEQANNGSIFLDEIGDLPLSLQSRFLRVIQEKQVMRLGSNAVIDINARIITATNKNLLDEVADGKFREDLYYRLNVLPIKLPALSERKEDILPIFYSFIGDNKKYLSDEMQNVLVSYSWPGNIRELKNVAEYFILMKNVDVIKSRLQCAQTTKKKNDIIENFAQRFVPLPDTLQTVTEILSIIIEFSMVGKGIGRNKIILELTERKFHISEKKVEKILLYLLNEGYVTREKGRTGVKITEEGFAFYNKTIGA